MQENGTVQQLSKALNQLLDAYEILQEESKVLSEENATLKEEIDDLEAKNKALDDRLCTLNDTTKYNSNEVDTMLGRIKNILDPIVTEEKIEEKLVVLDEKIEEEVKTPVEDNKEIDLGRMQSLLNGFSN